MNTRIIKIFKLLIIIITVLLGLSIFIAGTVFYKIYTIKDILSNVEAPTSEFIERIHFDYIDNMIIVKAKTNSHSKQNSFLIDTGAPTIISNSFFKNLNPSGIKIINTNYGNSKGAFEEFMVTIDSIKIQGVTFKNIGALVIDDSKMGEKFNSLIDGGVIGYNILSNCMVRIDYDKMILTLAHQDYNFGDIENSKRVNFEFAKLRSKNAEKPKKTNSIKLNLNSIFGDQIQKHQQ
ncbi:MAG: clan AA aspartic protease [Candidatus Delongbacteria bacterium]|nr:clan AA aspartic protease [Candidatus Delongbacteria bacterium]MBN2833660.1 clan AA aspartic protease [Candidatus Delongbacteria bacterium]